MEVINSLPEVSADDERDYRLRGKLQLLGVLLHVLVTSNVAIPDQSEVVKRLLTGKILFA